MLSATRVLKYIKAQLGHPVVHIELSDDDILEHIQEFTLREWSQYFPQERSMAVSLTSTTNRVPGKLNEIYIYEPDGLEILNVIEVIPSMGSYLLFGHPPLGAFTMGDVKQFALDVEASMTIKQFSTYDITHEYTHPNILRISPYNPGTDWIVVRYERMQPSDFRGIDNEFQVFFMEFALADIMIILGRIRKKYGGGQMRTPFGEIPLEAEIGDEGKEKKREILEKLVAGSLPNVTIDIG